MDQRQPRLGDILDDYCPRERRLTNHVVVALVGQDVKQTRCTTCDTEHAFKHAKVPRQRRKPTIPAALYAQVASGAPKRVAHDHEAPDTHDVNRPPVNAGNAGATNSPAPPAQEIAVASGASASAPQAAQQQDPHDAIEADGAGGSPSDDDREEEDGPVHRPLIRASLPRAEGQPPPARPLPEFTIRQPGGRQNRFHPRHQQGGGQSFQGNRSGGNTGGGPMRSGSGARQGTGRPAQGGPPSRFVRRDGPGRKRSK